MSSEEIRVSKYSEAERRAIAEEFGKVKGAARYAAAASYSLPYGTVYNWCRKYGFYMAGQRPSYPADRRYFSDEDKLRILRELDGAPLGGRNAVMRRHDVTWSQVAGWRKGLGVPGYNGPVERPYKGPAEPRSGETGMLASLEGRRSELLRKREAIGAELEEIDGKLRDLYARAIAELTARSRALGDGSGED